MLRSASGLVVTLLLVGFSTAAAQTIGGSTIGKSPDNYPAPLPPRPEAALPGLRFVEDTRLDLAAARGTETTRIDGDRVRISLNDGPAFFSAADSLRRIEPDRDWPEASSVDWVHSADGRVRYRTLPEGRIEMEKQGRRRWKPRWNLRVGGGTPAPPLSVGVRLFFGSLDNQVYGLRADNGHELWRADLFGRISWPLLPWQGTLRQEGTAALAADLVLALPDDGSRLVALDAYDGRRAATLELPAEYALVPPALILSDGRVVALRQGYADDDLSLIVYRLEPADSSASLVYNAEPAPERGAGDVDGG